LKRSHTQAFIREIGALHETPSELKIDATLVLMVKVLSVYQFKDYIGLAHI